VVLFRVLTLDAPAGTTGQTVSNGLGYMWNADFSKLWNAESWLQAAGQIFFSLSVGFGVIINYASYLKKKDDVVLSGLTSSATNELFEVGFGGLITIPAAFVFLGVTLAAVPGGTFGLGFQTLPVVFAQMPGGNAIGALWFFMLFLAAITSSLSMLQPTLAFLEEALGWSRKKGTLILSGVALTGNLFVLYYSKGLGALSAIDNWVGTLLIFVLATAQIICFGWVWGIDKGIAEAHRGAQMRIPAFFIFVMKYVTPVYLLVVFFFFCKDNLPVWAREAADSVEQKTALGFVAVITALLVAATAVGAKRWRAQGLDLDGTRPPDDEKA
jgi:NSS family neurotransmitter:Na+ symporter